MRVNTLILTMILNAMMAFGFAHADDHVGPIKDGMPVQPEDVIVEEESIEIPLKHKNMNGQAVVPKRGMSQAAVRKAFGEPEKTIPPKGKPPISRWIYKDFTVYFESGWVIHTVKTP